MLFLKQSTIFVKLKIFEINNKKLITHSESCTNKYMYRNFNIIRILSRIEQLGLRNPALHTYGNCKNTSSLMFTTICFISRSGLIKHYDQNFLLSLTAFNILAFPFDLVCEISLRFFLVERLVSIS